MRVLIVLVNWNGWRDSIECLEALRRCRGNFDVVLCDNGSTDGSLEQIQAWADSQLAADTQGPPWAHLLAAPILRTATYRNLAKPAATADLTWLTLIPTGGNLGFAGGNNVGLRYGLEQDYDAFWLLNTDTVVEPDALEHLVARVQADPSIGLCGASVLYYADPSKVQCFGGSEYVPRRAAGRYIGYLQPPTPAPSPAALEGKLDYIVGASMFVTRAFVETIGLMSEDYFLYFEEMDWSARNNGRFRVTYAPESFVYHKHGGSVGGSSARSRPSRTLIIYSGVNRIFFTRRFYKQHTLTVLAAIGLDCVKLAARGHLFSAFSLMCSALKGFSQGGGAVAAEAATQ